MGTSAEFVAFVREQLSPLGGLSDGTFFGGHALKQHGRQFAMVMGNTLYFCVDDATRPQFEQRGCKAFSYATKTKVVQVRKYFSVPPKLFDDPAQMLQWARHAIDAASGTRPSSQSP